MAMMTPEGQRVNMGHLRGERLQRAATVCVDDLEEVGAIRWELLGDPGEDGCLPGISHDNGEAMDRRSHGSWIFGGMTQNRRSLIFW